MAPQSTCLCTKMIKFNRKKQGLTQEEVADSIDISPRQYQSIESDGKTSSKTANRLAELFSVDLASLKQNKRNDNFWYITHSDDDKEGQIKHSISTILFEIEKCCGKGLYPTKIYITDNTMRKKIEIKYEDDEVEETYMTFYVQPVSISDIGIRFIELSDFGQYVWSEFLNSLKYDFSFNVIHNETPISVADKQLQYRVDFFETESRDSESIQHTGFRCFDYSVQFINSLYKYINEGLIDAPYTSFHADTFTPGQLNIINLGIKNNKKLRICRGYFDNGSPNSFKTTPWPQYHRELLSKNINSWKIDNILPYYPIPEKEKELTLEDITMTPSPPLAKA